jgi:hypothetical protein
VLLLDVSVSTAPASLVKAASLCRNNGWDPEDHGRKVQYAGDIVARWHNERIIRIDPTAGRVSDAAHAERIPRTAIS